MTIGEILSLGVGGGLIVLLTLIEVTPIKINPWTAIARGIGKAINHDIMQELETVKANQTKTQQQLEELTRIDDERNADRLRERILKFNLELMRGEKHTREDFVEILNVIDAYEDYCDTHPDYPNNRAEMAKKNIKEVYAELVKQRAFFKDDEI